MFVATVVIITLIDTVGRFAALYSQNTSRDLKFMVLDGLIGLGLIVWGAYLLGAEK